MERLWTATPHRPGRLSPRWAKLLIGLSLFTLVLAVGGVFLYDGWQRIAYVTAFTTMGLANLASASGSLLPEGRLSRALRIAAPALAAVMLLALGASLVFLFDRGR